MERMRSMVWLWLLLVFLAGCETMRPLNPLSRSHGLPPQTETVE